MTVRVASELPVDDATAWHQALSAPHINDELWPWLRLRSPVPDLQAAGEVRLGEPLFQVWLLAFGVVPVDRMRIVPVVLEARRFVEESSLLSVRRWRHERIVEPTDDGCRVIDQIDVDPRVPGLHGLAEALVGALFRWRHRRLRRRFSAQARI